MDILKKLMDETHKKLTKSENLDYSEVILLIKDNRIDELKNFIKEKNFNLNDYYGAKILPLEYALYIKNSFAIDVLINLGANVNFHNKENKNRAYPILSVASIGQNETLLNLIEKGMKVNNKTGIDCLNNALANWQIPIAKTLITYGVNYKKIKYTNVHQNVINEIEKFILEIEIKKEKEKLDKKINKSTSSPVHIKL